ncbi:MAG TPA: IS110 family transposase [Candidatus Methylomirabilis sp.]|nr:IS110 family transposase [Candidatus Methylomirabilis sp.]
MSQSSTLPQLNPQAAGVDIGAHSHFVAVPPGSDPDGRDVREFDTFTADLYALADWLSQCGVTTVAMESTGIYWIPLFQILEERRFEVKLVDPRRMKHVPGRKTDVVDCQWIQQLHSFGLLDGAFRPSDDIVLLRGFLRQRAMLLRCGAQHIQHIHKALEQMNLKLHLVVSNIVGVTGLRIIRTILAGERDPDKLAALRDRRCKNDVATIARALHGHYRSDLLFSLRQAVELFDIFQRKVAECDAEIETLLASFPDGSQGRTLPPARRKGSAYRNAPAFDARAALFRISGVDLTRIEGIDTSIALTLISEIGLDMSRWPSEKHFASWLGLCPGSKISGGRVLSSRSKRCANRAAAAFRLAAHGLHNAHSALGAFLRRKKAQLGAPKAITATAHKIARLVYALLRYGSDYVEVGEQEYERRYRARIVNNLERRARTFGFTLVRDPRPPSPSPLPT